MIRLRNILIAAGLILVAAFGVVAARFYYFTRDPAAKLLRESFHVTYTTPASYLQTVEHKFGPSGAREVFEVWQDGRTRRVVQVQPETRRGLTVVVKAPVSWVYSPGVSTVLQSHVPRLLPLERSGPRRLFAAAPRAVIEGTATIGGQRTTVIAIGARDGVRLRLWVREPSHFIIRQERYDRRGDPLDTTTNTQVAHNVAEIRSILATPRPRLPETSDRAKWMREFVVHDLKRQATFRFALPANLPRGYRLQSGDVFELDGSKVVAIRISRHRRVISLFQKRGTLDFGPNEKLPLNGHGRKVTLQKREINGQDFVLVGPLSDIDTGAFWKSLEWYEPQRAKAPPQKSNEEESNKEN